MKNFFKLKIFIVFSVVFFLTNNVISQMNGVYKGESGLKLIIKDYNKDTGFNIELTGEKCICEEINGWCEAFYPQNPNEKIYYLYYKNNEEGSSEPPEPTIKLTPKNGVIYVDYFNDSDIMCPTCWGLDKTFKKVIPKTQNSSQNKTKKPSKK